MIALDRNALRQGLLRTAVVGVLAYLSTGCGAAMIWTRVAELDDDIPRKGTAIALQTAIHTMDNPITQEHIQHMLARPEVQRTQTAMIGGFVDSTFAALGDKERSERIGAFATQTVSGMMAGATRELPGIIDGVTRSAVGGAMDEALDPARQQKLEGALASLVSTGVRSAADGLRDAELGKALSETMSNELGPAFQKSMRDDVAVGVAAMLENERLQRALGATARVMGREMVAGANEALAEKAAKKSGTLSELFASGARLFGSAAWVLLLVIVLLLTWIVKLAMDARRYREEAHRRAAMARLLEETAKAAEGKPGAAELFNTVRDRLSLEEKVLRESKPPARWRWRKPRERTV